VITLATGVLAALDVAHQHGIVHRDLKPENLFLVKDGPVKVLDFGLVKRLPVDGSGAPSGELRTETGALLGTLHYMAPEQVRGANIDGRTDVFALGAVLHECLRGTPAFAAETVVATLYRIMHDEPRPLAETAPAVPAWLSAFVERCLAKEPAERFSSASLAAQALAAARDGTAPDLWAARRATRPPAPPPAGYVQVEGVHVAHQTFGEGPGELLVAQGFVSNLEQLWDDPDSARFLQALDVFGPSVQQDPEKRRWWARWERMSASPRAAAALLALTEREDVRSELGLLRLPIVILHRTGDQAVPIEAGQYLARRIPGARLIELPGVDHIPMMGDVQRIIDEVAAAGAATAGTPLRPAPPVPTHVVLRRAERASEPAAFPDAAAALEHAMRVAAAEGTAVRAALHAEMRHGDPAPEVAERMLAQARPGEVLVTGVVRGLTVDAGWVYHDRGVHPVDTRRALRLFAVHHG
jgi:pimeloyl-ACP methyl ester carboxylesterase